MQMGFLKLLLILAKTPTFNLSKDDIRMVATIGRIKEDIILQQDNIKNIIICKFTKNMWCNKELNDKRKVRYYKEVDNPNLENFLFVLSSIKKKINIDKIRTNSHKLHSEIGH